MQPESRSHRSVLYVPASNGRAVGKARTLGCDAVILDLEDAVAPDAKGEARINAVAALAEGGFGGREVVVRVNGLDTPFWPDDAALLRDGRSPILVPKVGSPEDLAMVAEALPDRPLWAMIETCRGVLDVAGIARSAKRMPLAALVIGANDLAKEIGCRLGASRKPIWGGLGLAVAAARENGLMILDAVFNNIEDETGFVSECREGSDFGFDGKTLVHPKQIDVCNRIFSPTADEVAFARRVVDAFAEPHNAAVNVLRIDGRMVERLHLDPAMRILARA